MIQVKWMIFVFDRGIQRFFIFKVSPINQFKIKFRFWKIVNFKTFLCRLWAGTPVRALGIYSYPSVMANLI